MERVTISTVELTAFYAELDSLNGAERTNRSFEIAERIAQLIKEGK